MRTIPTAIKHLLISAICLACIVIFSCGSSIAASNSNAPVRVSAWYWLNSAPKADWEGDCVTMKNLGFTDVLMCWGLDLSAVATRKVDTKHAMQAAHKAGIGVYLVVWQPSANSLPRKSEFMQVNAAGKELLTFDVFNPQWRNTQWKSYLQDLATAYRDEPAMAGFVFDDSFGGGTISYGAYEEKTFGAPLPRKPEDARWAEWTKARQGWWEDWAKDTVQYIRAVDANTNHEIYLEDTINTIINKKRQDAAGVDFARLAKYFDAVGGYTISSWSTNIDSQKKVLQVTENAIKSVRQMIGPNKQIKYTFWSANAVEEHKPGVAKFPSASQIKEICEVALKLGVRHLDMYGYRIGDYKATREEMARRVPAEPAPYVLTGQFPHKFIWDRPELQTELGNYLRSLNGK
jgi:hypothetical protein